MSISGPSFHWRSTISWRSLKAHQHGTRTHFDSARRNTGCCNVNHQVSTLTLCARTLVCSLDMLSIYKPCIVSSRITYLLYASRRPLRQAVRATIDNKAMAHELSSKPLLDAQSFGGDLLNRSIGDRRDVKFVQAAFESSSSLLVTGRSVMAKKANSNGNSGQRTELCWLAPEDFREYGIEPQTDSQTTVTGMKLDLANKLG